MTDRVLRMATAALVLAGGAIHLLEWSERLRYAPVVGPLFLVNAVSAVAVAALLFLWRGWIGLSAAVALSMGTVIGFLIARYGSFFGYSEPMWRTTAILATAVEVAAVVSATTAVARRVVGDTPAAAS